MKWLYLVLCILGTILPWSQFGPWFLEYGLSLPLFVEDAMATKVSTAAWLDLIVSAAVVLLFIGVEGKRLAMKRLWAPMITMVVVGVSLALPLFLYLRELEMERQSQETIAAL